MKSLIVFSHLRWDFVFQRPQHLMTRFAKDRRVVVFEEPVHIDGSESSIELREDKGVTVATPRLPHGRRLEPDPKLAELVPRRRSRAYDMTRVLGRILDDESLLELAPSYGRGLICALGHLDGHSVGTSDTRLWWFV